MADPDRPAKPQASAPAERETSRAASEAPRAAHADFPPAPAPAARYQMPRLGRPARARSKFGEALDNIILRRGLRASRVAEALGVTPSYLSALVTGAKPVSPERVEEIADSIEAAPEERTTLHRAAARDMGFRLDLPDDF